MSMSCSRSCNDHARRRGFGAVLSDCDTLNPPMHAAMERAGRHAANAAWHVWHYRVERLTECDHRYFGGACLPENPLHWPDMTTLRDLDLGELIADTEHEILRVLQLRDDSVSGAYELVRYHLGLDGADGPRGKRMRPLLGLLAYMSIAGDHERALPGAAAVELGHNFSLVHDDIEDNDTERRHRPTLWAVHGVRRRSTPATSCSACRGSRSIGCPISGSATRRSCGS